MKQPKNKSPFTGLKIKLNKFKIVALAALFAIALPSIFIGENLNFSGLTDFAYAAESKTRVNNLEYFELDKPLAVQTDGNSFYIAQSDLIVVYHNETYDKIDLTAVSPKVENVKDIKKCGTRLLILADNGLFSMNLATFEIKAIFSNVSAISVCENTSDNACVFAVHFTGERKISVYKITDQNNFVYAPVEKDYILMLGETNAFALCPDYSFYYAYSDAIYKHTESATNKATATAKTADFIQYASGTLYYKSGNKIYSLSQSAAKSEIADLSSFLSDPRGFTVFGGKLYACDYGKNKVVEYDVQTRSLTGFEISFTKIYLPTNFSINFAAALSSVTVKANSELYAVDLQSSLKNGFFSYVESFKQKVEREYLIVTEVEGGYYLIAGDCFALVDKSKGYAPKSISQTTVNKAAYAVSEADALKSPVDDALVLFSGANEIFKTFTVNKNQKITVLSKFKFGNYEYSLVQTESGLKGYLPSAVITESIYVPAKKTEFYTADTYHQATPVYSDKSLTNKIGELSPYSKIMIYGENGDVYEVKTESGLNGYISKNCVQKPSYYRVRTSIILIVAGLSFLITALFLEKKYLYSKKN